MLFWIAAALLTVVALVVVLWPFLRPAAADGTRVDFEVALFQSQIAAIEREEREGRISTGDAEASRVEVKRRMLTAARRRDQQSAQREGWLATLLDRPRSTRAAAIAIYVFVPTIALLVYLSGGSPNLPDEPYAGRAAERAAAGMPTKEEIGLVRKLAAQMARHPEDPKGWALLGSAYVRQDRYADAVTAYTNAVKRAPDNAEYESALGEAMVLRAGGEVTEPARATFKEALRKDQSEPRARYFLALAQAQTGHIADAVAEWKELLKSAPPNAPWRARVVAQLKQAQASLPKPSAGSSADGTAAVSSSSAAIASLPAKQRARMIRLMVDRLAQRLKKDPSDLEGWLRLARSYSVLAEPDKARTALDEAAKHFKGDAASLARIRQARAALTNGKGGDGVKPTGRLQP